MLPHTKITLKSSLSALFSRRKEHSGQLTGEVSQSFGQNSLLIYSQDHRSDLLKDAPPSIVLQGESSEVTEILQDTNNTGNYALDDYTQSATASGPRSNTPNIVGGDYEAPDVNMNSSSGFFNHAHHLVFPNSTMVDNSTNIINRLGGDREVKAKKLLAKHIIQGAAHDSSARDPPPQCHPGTRIKINERILAWFYDKNKGELILWIYGPAGVGKSAIVQTITEALAAAKCLGASVFFSRPNGRNNSRSVFITIAYQLAVHIGAYCAFISEKLAADPELVNKGMKEQFRNFIVEPFVDKKIGVGGKPWGILLDGLDELDEQRWQREIIRLVTAFALEHPDVPLVWVISSRPERHITNTFKGKQIISSYWEEYVPVDSPEACRDVELYLRRNFETVREEFPGIRQDWPEGLEFTKLAHAASGLFAFAETAIRFIQDPRYADPVSRLGEVLSAIDGARVTSVDDQPFSYLDALYTRILTPIPPEVWPITQRVLVSIKRVFESLRCTKGLSIILSLELSKIYTAINDLYSILKISVDDVYAPIRFHHASFLDFLGDVTRSGQFYTPVEDIGKGVEECSARIWLEFRKQSSREPSSKYGERWSKYASLQFHSDVNIPIDVSNTFNSSLFRWLHAVLPSALRTRRDLVLEEPSPRHWDQFLDLLCQIDIDTVCQGIMSLRDMVTFLFDTWEMHHEGLSAAGIAHKIRLDQLRLDQLEWPKECPRHVAACLRRDSGKLFKSWVQPLWTTNASSETFDEYVSGLKYFQQHNPTLDVLIYGPQGNRFAVFIYEYTEDDFTVAAPCCGR